MDNKISSVNAIIRDYKNSLSHAARLRAEIEIEKERLANYKNDVIKNLKSYGFSTKAELDAEIARLKASIREDADALKNEYMQLVQQCGVIEGQKTAFESMLDDKEKELVAINDAINLNTSVYSFLIGLTDSIRTRTKEKIETIVTGGINQIFNFDPPFKFKIDTTIKGNRNYAEFLLENDTSKFSSSVLDSYGGGVSDVVGTILRLCLLEFQVPKNTAPVVLDEVGKFVSADYQEKFADFLKEWSKSFGRQIILVSHKPEVITRADKIIRIDKKGDVSTAI